MKKDIIILVLLLMLYLLLLPSCKSKEEHANENMNEVSTDTSSLGDVSYLNSMEKITLPERNNITDIVQTEEGFLILSNYDSATMFIWLSHDWDIIREEVEFTSFVSACFHNGELYLLEKRDDCYVLLGNDKELAQFDELRSSRHDLISTDYGVYVLFDTALYYENTSVSLPDPSFGFQWRLNGFYVKGNRCFLHASEIPELPSVHGGITYSLEINKDKIMNQTLCDNEIREALCFAGTNTGTFFIAQDTIYYHEGSLYKKIGSLSLLGIQNGVIQTIFPLKSGELILSSNEELYRLAPVEETEKTTVLRVINFSTDNEVEREILLFNQNNPSISVEIIHSSLDNDALSLKRELLNQNVDLILYSTDNYSAIRSLIKNDMFQPLDDVFLSSAIETSLFPNLIHLSKIDGEVYSIPIQFYLSGFSLPEDIIGNRVSFHGFSEFKETVLSLSDQRFRKGTTREAALSYGGYYAIRGYEDWVDWETNTCFFCEDSFIELIEFMNQYADDEDEANANHSGGNTPLLSPYDIFDVRGLSSLELLYEEKGSGLPYSNYSVRGEVFAVPGNGSYSGLSIRSRSMIAVPVGTPHLSEIGILLEYLFSKEAQDRMLIDTEQSDDIPMRSDSLTNAFTVYEVPAVEQKKLLNLIITADSYAIGPGGHVAEIVCEETFRYFSGEITAKQAAEYVQNRVSLYLAEQG